MTAPFEIAIDSLKVGDVLVADAGFDCLAEGEEVTVMSATQPARFRDLYVRCIHGEHYLDGLIKPGGVIVGFRRKTAEIIAFPGVET